jgi:hypothetical protein
MADAESVRDAAAAAAAAAAQAVWAVAELEVELRASPVLTVAQVQPVHADKTAAVPSRRDAPVAAVETAYRPTRQLRYVKTPPVCTK